MLNQRRTPWQLTRLCMIMCWFFWIVTFFITVTLFQAVLQIKVVAQVVQDKDRSFNVFNEELNIVYPMSSVSYQKINEMLVRYYLEMRYTFIPDSLEMNRRWGRMGPMAILSTWPVYSEFIKGSPSLDDIERLPPQVIDITSLKEEGDRYMVDFDLYVSDNYSNLRKQTKSVVLNFAHSANRVFLGEEISNPYGFIVTRFNESSKETER